MSDAPNTNKTLDRKFAFDQAYGLQTIQPEINQFSDISTVGLQQKSKSNLNLNLTGQAVEIGKNGNF
jgi:hypothetical protein